MKAATAKEEQQDEYDYLEHYNGNMITGIKEDMLDWCKVKVPSGRLKNHLITKFLLK